MDALGIVIFLLISVGIWIIQYVFREPENNKQRPRQRQPGQPPVRPQQGQPRPRKPVTGLDQFLEEARKSKEERKPVMAELAPDPELEREREREREREQQRERERERERERIEERRAPRSKPRPERKPQRPPPSQAEPVLRPALSRPLHEEVAPLMLERTAVAVAVAVPAPINVPIDTRESPRDMSKPLPSAAAAQVTSRAASNVTMIKELLTLMRQPRGLAVAMILHEILDPPLVLRREGKLRTP